MAIVLALTLGDSAGTGWADPAADALARLTELSREAERTTEAVYSAELDLEAKLATQRRAEERQRAELEAMADTLQALADGCSGDDRPDCPILADLETGKASAARPGPRRFGVTNPKSQEH